MRIKHLAKVLLLLLHTTQETQVHLKWMISFLTHSALCIESVLHVAHCGVSIDLPV